MFVVRPFQNRAGQFLGWGPADKFTICKCLSLYFLISRCLAVKYCAFNRKLVRSIKHEKSNLFLPLRKCISNLKCILKTKFNIESMKNERNTGSKFIESFAWTLIVLGLEFFHQTKNNSCVLFNYKVKLDTIRKVDKPTLWIFNISYFSNHFQVCNWTMLDID